MSARRIFSLVSGRKGKTPGKKREFPKKFAYRFESRQVRLRDTQGFLQRSVDPRPCPDP